MLYLDTCVLLALLTPEVHSAAASAFLEQAAETLAISPWTATELHSALALKVRTGALSATEADRVLEVFESSLAPGLLWLDLEADDFRNANACLRGWSTSLRTADALHLAIASGRGATLCSLDAPFVQAAQQLGLAALLINSVPAITMGCNCQ
jgi:predicted nucleic acid-binding protein